MEIFSAAQIAGYGAFVLGVAAFLQTSDRRLKVLLSGETFAYLVHFLLLGNTAAAVSSAVSGVRTLLSIRFRSPWLALAIVVINVTLGALVAVSWTSWLPVIGASLSTFAVFLLDGVRMRLTIFLGTLLWLANNIVSGSIGGTVLETFIAIANGITILRMTVWKREA